MQTTPWECYIYRVIKDLRKRKFWSNRIHFVYLAIKYWFQRRLWGFCDFDTFSMDHHIAVLMVPRLKRFKFKAQRFGYPGKLSSMEEWVSILDEMIEGFEIIEKGGKYDIPWGPQGQNDPNYTKMERALDLFREYYFNLWW